MLTKNIFRQITAGAALTAALGFGSAQSLALESFTIDESVVEAAGGLEVGNTFNGRYGETLSFGLDGPGTFSAAAFANLTALYTGVDGDVFVAGTELGTNYRLYALFNATGTIAPQSIPGLVTIFIPSDATFTLYLDRDNNTTFTLPALGSGSVTTGSDADDSELATASVLAGGSGSLLTVPGQPTTGSFRFVFNDFTLNALGDSYFTLPEDFYFIVDISGDIDSVAGTNPQTITGDISATFSGQVPEPGSVALIGLGLLGLGALRRRKA